MRDTESSLREEIIDIRGDLDRTSCAEEEKGFGDARTAVIKLIDTHYNGSTVYFFLSCISIPIVISLVFILLYFSAKMLNARITRARLARHMRSSPIIIAELQQRKLSQASLRAARRRTVFVIIVKCIIATLALVTFMSSRVLMELGVRGWLRDYLFSSSSSSINSQQDEYSPYYSSSSSKKNTQVDIWEEIYTDIVGLLHINWFKDLQSLFIFSSVGSGILIFGLRLLKSATEDTISMQTRATAPLQLLHKIDQQHAAQGQQLMQKQLTELVAMLSQYVETQAKVLKDKKENDYEQIKEEEENKNEEEVEKKQKKEKEEMENKQKKKDEKKEGTEVNKKKNKKDVGKKVVDSKVEKKRESESGEHPTATPDAKKKQ